MAAFDNDEPTLKYSRRRQLHAALQSHAARAARPTPRRFWALVGAVHSDERRATSDERRGVCVPVPMPPWWAVWWLLLSDWSCMVRWWSADWCARLAQASSRPVVPARRAGGGGGTPPVWWLVGPSTRARVRAAHAAVVETRQDGHGGVSDLHVVEPAPRSNASPP